MGRLWLMSCWLILAGCKQSDNFGGEESRISSATHSPTGNAKIYNGRALQEPLLETTSTHLESATTGSILDSIASKAASETGVRLYFFPAVDSDLLSHAQSRQSQSHRVNLAELDHAIRAAKIPKLTWRKIMLENCDDALGCRHHSLQD